MAASIARPLAVEPRAGARVAGAVAGPLYVGVSLVEVVTREGFDQTRHAWSQLANGDLGWIHSANLVVSGLLVILGALGLQRRWVRIGIALYGAGLVGAGFFTADPGRGFPVGTPETVDVTTHGILHFVCGGIGFVGLVTACFLVRTTFSRVTGALFGVTFVAMAATGGAAWALLAFTAAVILASAWLSTVFWKGL
ncbi:DUF998 domain-containing protein [Cryptosporangium sp. NPDC048952]|uniref:DUF998 domain-containing protein n=1 Tax=Cryptosporangium sp. NPDC048952 TaxID=3363961 RepID=UPI00371418B0